MHAPHVHLGAKNVGFEPLDLSGHKKYLVYNMCSSGIKNRENGKSFVLEI